MRSAQVAIRINGRQAPRFETVSGHLCSTKCRPPLTCPRDIVSVSASRVGLPTAAVAHKAGTIPSRTAHAAGFLCRMAQSICPPRFRTADVLEAIVDLDLDALGAGKRRLRPLTPPPAPSSWLICRVELTLSPAAGVSLLLCAPGGMSTLRRHSLSSRMRDGHKM
jgi:hypothetical protein